ncbi:MAG: hypothetical protein JW738_04700 [Actinobacteria bacterium]|nr:hypothetical protein [Actinomycetota bacterium]
MPYKTLTPKQKAKLKKYFSRFEKRAIRVPTETAVQKRRLASITGAQEHDKKRDKISKTRAIKQKSYVQKVLSSRILFNNKPVRTPEKAKEIKKEFLKHYCEVPVHPHIPQNALPLVNAASKLSGRYAQLLIKLVSNPDTHVLKIAPLPDTVPPHPRPLPPPVLTPLPTDTPLLTDTPPKADPAFYIMDPILLKVLSDELLAGKEKADVPNLLLQLENKLLKGHSLTTIKQWIDIQLNGGLYIWSLANKARFLKGVCRLVLDLDDGDYLYMDDSERAEFILHMISLFSAAERSEALGLDDDGDSHTSILLKRMVDKFSLWSAEEQYADLLARIISFKNEALDVLYLIRLNRAGETIYARIIQVDDWEADNVSTAFALQHEIRELGEWVLYPLRAELCAYSMFGYWHADDEVDAFRKYLDACEHDQWIGVSSAGHLLARLIEVAGSLDEDCEEEIRDFKGTTSRGDLAPTQEEKQKNNDFVTIYNTLYSISQDSYKKFVVSAIDNYEMFIEEFPRGLLVCSNPKNVVEASNHNAARILLAETVDIIDEEGGVYDDNIIMENWGDVDVWGVQFMKWATIATLNSIIHILDEGWTTDDEERLIDACEDAIRLINKGEGSGSL